MIAAARRRIRPAPKRLAKRFRALPSAARSLSGRLDRGANRALLAAAPPLRDAGRRLRRAAAVLLGRAWRLLRPAVVALLRLLGVGERSLLAAAALARAAATRAAAVLTPGRATCLAVLAAALALGASQFSVYSVVEIGQPGYAELPGGAAPPTVAAEDAGAAHAYALAPLAALAALLALAALARPGRRAGLGRVIILLGLAALAVVLAVDLPAGLDAGAEAARFSGAEAVLRDGFYAELAAAAGLILGGGLLVVAPKAAARYHARPCRTRTSSFARAATALRRRFRRRASSRGRGARRGSRRRSGAASAPASQR